MTVHCTVFGPSDDGAVFLTETLKVNHRYIVPRAWIEANVLPNISGPGSSNNFPVLLRCSRWIPLTSVLSTNGNYLLNVLAFGFQL